MPASPEIDVVTDPEVPLDHGLVVVGIPTLGLVGTITAHYLIDQLEMPRVGGVYSPRFPPVSRVTEGRSSFPVRVHALDTHCAIEPRCERLITVVTEFLPGPETLYAFSEALTRWAVAHDAAMLIVPDGLLVQGEEGSIIRAAAAQKDGLAPLGDPRIEALEGGLLMGFSATMLAQAERFDARTISLLAESAPDHPDARAAARLVEVLDEIVPDIDIETAPLIKEAEQIERQLKELRDQLDEQATRHEHPGYDQMYQ